MLKFVLLASLLVAGHHGSPVAQENSESAQLQPHQKQAVQEAVASYQKQIEKAVQAIFSAPGPAPVEQRSYVAPRAPFYYRPYAYPVYSFGGARNAAFDPFYFDPVRPETPFVPAAAPSARSPFPRPGLSDEESLAFLEQLKASQEPESRFFVVPTVTTSSGAVTITFPSFTSVLSSLIPTLGTTTVVKTTIGFGG